MTELHDRFRGLDRIVPPDLWSEASRRAEGPPGLRAVTPVLHRPSIATQQGSWRRVAILASASLLVAVLLGLAIVAGAALLRPRPTTLVPPERGVFMPTGSPAGSLLSHRATLLMDGRVLITEIAAAEVWDPATGEFTSVGSMPDNHEAASATRLADGKVLIAGGYWYGYSDGPDDAALLWDPATGSFSATDSLITARAFHSATLLGDGRILVVGGNSAGHELASAELWDPATGSFSSVGDLGHRYGHPTAMLLSDGRVLVIGDAAEIWDPRTGSFSPAPWPGGAFGTATLLQDDRVLLTGEESDGPRTGVTAEVWDPLTGSVESTWSPTEGCPCRAAVLLRDGRVLLMGESTTDHPLAAAGIWDPTTGRISSTGSLGESRVDPTATLLLDGRVLVVGSPDGGDGGGAPSAAVFELK